MAILKKQMKRPSVVFVDHVARLSGGEIALVRLLEAVGDSIEARVILGEDGPLVDRLRAVGADVEVLPLDTRVAAVRRGQVTASKLPWRQTVALGNDVARLRRRLLELKPDIVHTNSLKAALYGGLAGRLAGVPVVWHVRDRIADDYLPGSAVRLVRAAARVLPHAVVANSITTLTTIQVAGRSEVVYNRVVPDPLPQVPTQRRHDVPGLRIGLLGRLSTWKGQDVFLKAFAEAFPTGPHTAVLVGSAMFGEDDVEKSLRELVQRLGLEGRVDFRGFREDVPAELARLDVLVHASTTPEPFGQVIVEGMASGLPVVASAAGGPVEIIDHRRDGILVTPGDVEALASVLIELVADPWLRAELGSAAMASAARFGPAPVRERMLAVYGSVLSRA